MNKRKKLLLEPLEQRIMLDAVPDVQLDVPESGFLNEAFSFDITFENSGDQEGFKPFIDLTVPQGVDIDSIQFAGTELTKSEIEFEDADGDGVFTANHPITGEPLTQDTQDGTIALATVFAVEIPFGSFTTEQTVNLDITGTLNNESLLGVPIDIKAQGLFAFGNDALNNPGQDPAIRGDLLTSPITPTVIELEKENDAPEGETATGPNFVRTFTLSLDIADQETVDNIIIVDTLPDNLEFVGVTDNGGGIVNFDADTNQLTIDLGSIDGELGVDRTISYQAFVKEFAGDGSNVVNPVNGGAGVSINEAEVTAEFTDPDNLVIDTDDDGIADAPETVVLTDDAQSTIEDLALAIQKNAAIVENANTNVEGVSPGDTIEYTINFQVSDFFELQNLVFNDTFSDGQIFFEDFSPTFEIFNNNGEATVATQFAATDFDVVVNADETTSVEFRIDGDFTGGLSDDRAQNNGGLTGQIKFQTTVLEEFKLDGENVDVGDNITNNITVSAEIDGNRFLFDDSGTVLTIDDIEAQKQIVALNGINSDSGSVVPGDTVTFSLFIDLPTTDVEDFFIKDFLPLPVFEAIEFDGVVFTNEISADPPEAGVIRFGDRTTGLPTNPDGTIIDEFIPDIVIDEAQNSILFDFGDIEVENANSAQIEILFTVTTTDAPFGEGLKLTNQMIGSFSGLAEQGIINFTIREAVLDIDKAVVSISNPDAELVGPIGPVNFADPGSNGVAFSGIINSENLEDNRINSNVEDVNGGDLVKFAIVVENTGTAGNGAFDIVISDNFPPGFEIPDLNDFPEGLNLQVTDGAGNVLDFTRADDGDIVTGLEIFEDGIKLIDDPGDPDNSVLPSGALDPAAFLQIDPVQGEVEVANNTGSNIVVITYDLVVVDQVPANSKHVNEAFIDNFATAEGGENFAIADNGNPGLDLSDKAVAIIQDVQIDKQITNTSVNNDVNREVAIGEVVTFQLEVTLPDGTNDLNLVDNLPPGFDFLEGSERVITDIDGDGNDDFDGQNAADGSFDFTQVISRDTVLSPEVEIELEVFVEGVLVDDVNAAADVIAAGDNLVFQTTLTGAGDTDALDIVLTSDIPPTTVVNSVSLDIPGVTNGAVELQEGKHFTLREGKVIFDGIDDIELSLTDDLGLGGTMVFTIDTTVANVDSTTIDIEQVARVNDVELDAAGIAALQEGDVIEFSTTLTHNGTTSFTINPPVSYLETIPTNTTFDPESVAIISEGFIRPLNANSFTFNNATGELEITQFGGTQDLSVGESMRVNFSVVVGQDPVAENEILENDVVVDIKPVAVTDLSDIPSVNFGGDVSGNLAFTFRDVETFNDSGTFIVEYKAIVTNDAANVGLNNPLTTPEISNAQVIQTLFDADKNQTTINYQNQIRNGDIDSAEDTLEAATRIIFTDTPVGKLDTNSVTAEGFGLIEGTHFTVENGVLNIFDLSDIEDLEPGQAVIIGYTSVETGEITNVDDQSSVEFLGAEQTVLNNEVFADVLNDGTSAVKDIEHVIVTEPQIVVEKEMSEGIFDAGDTIEITLKIANPSAVNPFTGEDLELGATGAAFDIVIEDVLDNELFTAGTVIFTDTPDGFVGLEIDNGDGTSTIQFANPVDTDVSNTIAVDQELTFTFSVKLATSVNGNEFITNTFSVTEYSSVPNLTDSIPLDEDNPSEEEQRQLDDDATAIDNQRTFDAVDSNEVELQINTIEVQKEIIGDTDFTIGDIINYRVTIELPEATLQEFTFNDILDEGLAFVGVTSIVAATGITTDIGNFADVATNQAISDIGAGDTSVARQLDLNFGTVVNTNFTDGLAAANNTITVEYQAVVLNANIVQDGESFDNTVTISYEGRNPDADDATASINVVEPNVTVSKVVIDAETGLPVENTEGDAGDQLFFQITLESDGNADAFDIVLTDLIPDGISLVAGSLQTISGNADELNEDVANNSIEVIVEQLAVGESITVQFQIDVEDDVVLGEAIENVADITFTSLGDVEEQLLVDAAPTNVLAVERTGDPNDPGEDNNFIDDDNAFVTIFEPVLNKSIVATSADHTDADDPNNVQVAIGEVVRFRLDIEFPETVLDAVIISDTLADGLQFLGNTTLSFIADEDFSNDVNLEGADNDAIPPTFDLDAVAGAVVQNGQDIQFNLGDIQNNDRDDSVERIIIEFDALVTDDLAINVNNTEHRNTFDLNGDQLQDARTSNEVELNVEEPILQTALTQEVNGNVINTGDIANFDAGDIITYTADISHAGDSQSDAFDLNISLDIPTNTVIDATSFVIGGIAVDPTPFIVDDGNGNLSIELSADDLNNISANLDDLALNNTLTITYDTVVQDQANPGDTFAIDFDVDFTTLQGAVDDDANDQIIEERTRSVADTINMESVKQIAVETNIGVDNNNDGVVDLTNFQIGDDVPV
ncbi:isopeptide-forming domain-containing fimbrial protein, partial [Candidatus Uabimicrobium helgolandensis]